jgi:hypothetical protein
VSRAPGGESLKRGACRGQREEEHDTFASTTESGASANLEIEITQDRLGVCFCAIDHSSDGASRLQIIGVVEPHSNNHLTISPDQLYGLQDNQDLRYAFANTTDTAQYAFLETKATITFQ